MHHLIASYLFQNKSCPLPGLGNLSIHIAQSEADFTSKLIASPKPIIQFELAETDPDGLLNYVANKTNSNFYEVNEALDHLCDNLKSKISNGTEAKLEGIGNFLIDNNGNMVFEQLPLPDVFLQPVIAERVIHPKAEHNILVGDRETTNTVMTGYYNEEEPVKKSRWWIWAIVLGAIGLILLLLYVNSASAATAFGNAIKI